MPQIGTKAYLYLPDCHGQEALAVGSVRTNGAASCFGSVQDRGLVTEDGKQLSLHGTHTK